MDQQAEVLILRGTVMRLSLCVAALAEALAGSGDPGAAGVLRRWEDRLSELGLAQVGAT